MKILPAALAALLSVAPAFAPDRVTRLPTSPPRCQLGDLGKGQAYEDAWGQLCIVVRPAPPRDPFFGSTTGGPPIPQAGSRPDGWPEVGQPPAGWVFVVHVSTGHLAILPATWAAWPVAEFKATARTTH